MQNTSDYVTFMTLRHFWLVFRKIMQQSVLYLLDRGDFVLRDMWLIGQLLKRHQLSKAEIGSTDETISD